MATSGHFANVSANSRRHIRYDRFHAAGLAALCILRSVSAPLLGA